jgi:hypothetical protein
VTNLRGWVLGFAALCLLVPAVQATAAVSMGELQRQAQQMREREAKVWTQREAEQRAEMAKQEKLAGDALARRNRAEARSNALSAEFDQSSERIEEMRSVAPVPATWVKQPGVTRSPATPQRC